MTVNLLITKAKLK